MVVGRKRTTCDVLRGAAPKTLPGGMYCAYTQGDVYTARRGVLQRQSRTLVCFVYGKIGRRCS